VRKDAKHIFLVGVTGGIGSGKSEVCRILESLGVPVLSADEISKELSVANPCMRAKILALFGEQAYRADGSLNRPWIADQIFSNKSLQHRLEKIVHPAVFNEIEARVASLSVQGNRLAIVEAALIYESKLDRLLDAIIVVDASENYRLTRLQRRDHASVEEIRKRMRAQLGQSEKLARADYVLYNNGTTEELRGRVMFLHKVLLHLANS
jgi:dephospho-CoA kinase